MSHSRPVETPPEPTASTLPTVSIVKVEPQEAPRQPVPITAPTASMPHAPPKEPTPKLVASTPTTATVSNAKPKEVPSRGDAAMVTTARLVSMPKAEPQEAATQPVATAVIPASILHSRAQEAPTKRIGSTTATTNASRTEPQEAAPRPTARAVAGPRMSHARPQGAAHSPARRTTTTARLPDDRGGRDANSNRKLGEGRVQVRNEFSEPAAHSTSTAQRSRGTNKRSNDEGDTMGQAPAPKRIQTGIAQRTLTGMGMLGRYEVQQSSQRGPNLRTPDTSTATQTGNQRQRPPSYVQAPTEPHQLSTMVCGNEGCRKNTHELADCLGPPSERGDIVGCPLCNTQQHILDCCPKLPYETKESLFDLLVVRRANLPVIRTSISILSLAASLNRLSDLAETMPLTKTTVKMDYRKYKMWKRPWRPILRRDPTLPSDPEALLEKLDRAWQAVSFGTAHNYHTFDAAGVPDMLTIFNREWMCELVPFRQVFVDAGVFLEGRGYYPFMATKAAAGYEAAHKKKVKQELAALRRRRQAASRQRHR